MEEEGVVTGTCNKCGCPCHGHIGQCVECGCLECEGENGVEHIHPSSSGELTPLTQGLRHVG